MRTIIATLFVLALAVPAMAQTKAVVILDGQGGGYVVLDTMAAVPIVEVVTIGQTPTPPVPPLPPTLTAKVGTWAEPLGDPQGGARLALVYRTIADQVEAGAITKPADIAAATKQASDAVLRLSGEDAIQKWAGVRKNIGDELVRLNLTEPGDIATAYRQIADGLDSNEAILTPELIQLIIQLIMILLQSFGGGN